MFLVVARCFRSKSEILHYRHFLGVTQFVLIAIVCSNTAKNMAKQTDVSNIFQKTNYVYKERCMLALINYKIIGVFSALSNT